jgi:DNA-directed RNA polymerase specialized sigma24 family protein
MSQWSTVDQEADRRLVEGLNEGEDDALAELFDRYAGRLYDYAAAMSQEPKAAADIVHDALIDASRRAPRNRLGLRPWLYGAVRRRCLQRARGRGLYWDWEADPEAGKTAKPVLEGMLTRLDFTEQELLLLAVRHGLSGQELGAVTGLPARRVSSRAGKVQLKAEEAVVAELEAECRRCALGLELDPAEEPVLDSLELILAPAAQADPLAEHVVSCGACQSRARMTARNLLAQPPPAQLPKTLRHRVMHTGTDPELAGYRADIAARGGALTPDGMPRQPDVPSPTARRWIFTGGGMVGAGVTALAAALFIGAGLQSAYLTWPWNNHEGSPQTSPSQSGPGHHRDRQNLANPSTGGGPVAQPLPLPGGRTDSPQPSSSPAPSSGSPTPVGTLTVAQTSVELTAVQRTAYIDLSAGQATVSWTAAASNPAVQMSAQQGTIAKDGSARISVSMAPSLLQFPGQGQITFITGSGQTRTVTVTWGLSLL